MKYPKNHRFIATFFLLIFFPTLFPANLFASNNGPNCFEAANFEPVDATDMVNLATGDLAYVLPLLNVPSPEGGYPLALSYHAGIAMDQEASWVGLGWSLNPGAINRSLNGYPDDVAGDERTFIYDEGGEDDYYSVGIGASFNGVTVGVGAYWGSNKTLGGSVSFGYEFINGTIGAGSEGFNINAGLMAQFNYIKPSEMNSAGKIEHGRTTLSTIQHINEGMSSMGLGEFSNTTVNISQNDYDISVTSQNYGLANFYFGHTKVIYGLFNEKNSSYFGILFPYVFQESSINNGTSVLLFSKDVKRLVMYEPNTDFSNINDSKKDNLFNNSLLPNYDNYRVNAQGISGSISPTFLKEIPLADQNLKNYIGNSEDLAYFTSSAVYPNYNFSLLAQDKIYFEFENNNSSFMRIDRTNIVRDLLLDGNTTDFNLVNKYAKTNNTNLYDENVNSEGISLKNNNRKRTGRFIETFTNGQIRSSNGVVGFVEAKNLNRANDYVYKNESIGGFRVTDIDGKIYHYSLPVVNYETWYKNYKVQNNEDSQFILKENTTPYATDWLLTAITGSDYVDSNNNGILDTQDYGYWVEFDYGKWSDGYIWKGGDVIKGEEGEEDRYEYYMGRKQIYYLDAIKTRTHTAYFVKSLRQDAEGQNWINYSTKLLPGQTFNPQVNSKVYSSAFERWYCLLGGNCQGTGDNTFEAPNLVGYRVPTQLPITNHPIVGVKGVKKFFSYKDIPKNLSLKLDKVILINNNKNVTINKSLGSPIAEQKTGYLYENGAFIVNYAKRQDLEYTSAVNGTYFNNPLEGLKTFNIHQSQNVIDNNDIVNLNLESIPDKIVKFSYDYSLMLNSKNSTAINKGRLTLLDLQFLGSTGVSVMPKYRFAYNKFSNSFNENAKDGWGYHNTFPQNASLIEIKTPSGSKINIDYETDDYNKSIARSSLSSTFGKGGGVRVKEIKVSDQLYNETYKTRYYYNKQGFDKRAISTNYLSSGEVSFIPSRSKIKLPYASEIPPPMVIYGNVSIETVNKNDELLGRTDYEFETYGIKENIQNSIYNLGNKLTIIKSQNENLLSGKINFSKYNIKSKLSNLGRIKSVKSYNSLGQLLNATKNHYKEEQESDTDYGVKQETFISKYHKRPQEIILNVNSASTITYPSKLIGSTSTIGGITYNTNYGKSDFLTGLPLDNVFSSSDGKKFKSRTLPAYHKYGGTQTIPGMGSKVDNINNKNLLIQTTAQYSYIFNNGVWKETGVGITTWNNNWNYQDIDGSNQSPVLEKEKIWRAHRTYVWNGSKTNGIFDTYDNNTDDNFNWIGIGTQPAVWKQLSEITLYDHYSSVLETKNIDGNLASNKMDYNNAKVIASGNAGFNEIFYTGGENIKTIGNLFYLEPDVKIDFATMRTNSLAHTGDYSILANPSQNFGVVMRANQHKSGKYKLSVWVHKDNEINARVNINGVVTSFNGVNETVKAGEWVLKTHYINSQNSQQEEVFVTSANGIVYFDDFMLRPVSSSIIGYVYNDKNQLTYTIGSNGLGTQYKYDPVTGVLNETYVEVIEGNGITNQESGFKLKARSNIKFKNM